MPDKITLMAPDGSIHYFDTWDELTDALKRAIADEELPSGMRYEAVVLLEDLESQLKEYGHT